MRRRVGLGMRLLAVVLLAVLLPYDMTSSSAEGFSVVVSPEKETQTTASEDFVVEILQEEHNPAQHELRILIYHTHTFEAYEPKADEPYQETERWRTRDNKHNVVAVGEALAGSLRALGFTVVHDTTSFEPPSIDQAYERSRQMLEDRMTNGEVYDLIIDLHRDALSSRTTIKKTVNIGGEEVARFMVLIGKGTTGGYAEKPEWERNLVIAQAITDALNAQCDTLARNVKIKTGRFNQHISDRCVLIECGMNMNTLEQVLAGVPYLAEAIRQALLNGTENPPALKETSAAGGLLITAWQGKGGIHPAWL